MPALIYAWDVIGIARQVAPFVPAGPRLLVRDEAKLGWEEIEETMAWSDDEGRADYVLRCELLLDEPKRSRGRDG